MVEASIGKWETAFEDLSLELSDAQAPEGADGEWLEALAEFSRHSFARLLLSPVADRIRIRLEIALGPPGDDDEALVAAVGDRLGHTTDGDWDAAVDQTPWFFETELIDDDDGARKLRQLLLYVLELTEHFDAVDAPGKWFDIVEHSSSDDGTTDSGGRTEPSESPFETIGDGSTDGDVLPAQSATLESWKTTRVGDAVRAAIGFSQVLSGDQTRALTQGLESHIHAKFDAQARRIDGDDRSELRLPTSARTTLYFDIDPGGYADGVDALRSDMDSFIERLDQFCSYGVDLFEYLGVADTILDSDEDTADERTLSFEERASRTGRREPPPRRGDEEAVVLDLGSKGATDSLESQHYTDPRLQRDDATTPLVDIVLRHPGYSDRRIGQVLSILLSIEYHDAVDLADTAPCVIAWGIGRQRARSFKDVIESAGGKVVLVEPGTFGED